MMYTRSVTRIALLIFCFLYLMEMLRTVNETIDDSKLTLTLDPVSIVALAKI